METALAVLYEELLYEQLECPCSSRRGYEIQEKLDQMEQEANRHGLTYAVKNNTVVLRSLNQHE